MRSSEIAYERLREDIIHWRLQPGAALGEVELAERLGVSRTPVREALLRLTAEGLVSTDGGRTATVSAVSPDNIRDLYELREALETQAARLAARRRDASVFEALRKKILDEIAEADRPGRVEEPVVASSQLFAAIQEAAGSVYLAGALHDLRGPLERVWRHGQRSPWRRSASAAEQLLIVEAIIDQDETLAIQAMAVHLRNSLAYLLRGMPSATPDET